MLAQVHKAVTFSVDVTDESGINWSAGPNRTNVVFDIQHQAINGQRAQMITPGNYLYPSIKATKGAWTILRSTDYRYIW